MSLTNCCTQKKTIEILAKTGSVEEIFQNIKQILKNIDWEFRQIVDKKISFKSPFTKYLI